MSENLSDDEIAQLLELFDLAREGRTAELLDAVAAGVPPDLTGPTGDTFLILAAYYDHADTVRALLGVGADTERVNDRGQNALGAAVFRRSTPIVQALLAAGADPRSGGRSALEIAEFFELEEMRQLLRSSAGPTERRARDD